MFKYIVKGNLEVVTGNVPEYTTLKKEKTDNDGQLVEAYVRFAKLSIPLFKNDMLAYWRPKFAGYKHSVLSPDGAGRLTDAKHIVKIREMEAEAKAAISAANADIVAVPREQRIATLREDTKLYLMQHGADAASAARMAADVVRQYPSDAAILSSNLSISYYEIDDGCQTVTPAELKQALAETAANDKEASVQTLYHLYLCDVLTAVVSYIKQAAVKGADKVANSTRVSLIESIEALRGANATMFGNPIPEISTFLDHFAPHAEDELYQTCIINGIVRFYYEHGMKGFLPTALQSIGYNSEFLDDIGTNPYARASFAEQLADLGG